MIEHSTHSSHYTEEDADSKPILGFWIYIMTDCILFACLFATYVVLHNGTYGGPTSRDIFHLPSVLAETLILLTSSFTCGLVMLAGSQKKKALTLTWLIITALLGLSFLGLELYEFRDLCQAGNSWKRSGFLSAFFTLVGTHGLHITAGLLWSVVLMWHIVYKGFTHHTMRRLSCFSLFWHFLDVIWIFIFTIVYLMGVL